MKPRVLKARQPSNIAIVTLAPGRPAHWTYYTSSFGGTQWDGRRFRSSDQARGAAYSAGFGTVRVNR
jgi:hypothetical protein